VGDAVLQAVQQNTVGVPVDPPLFVPVLDPRGEFDCRHRLAHLPAGVVLQWFLPGQRQRVDLVQVQVGVDEGGYDQVARGVQFRVAA